jgi:bifunctional UDP-N-acetylglucosamine pyrophosphorylase/glucosamine-1-phosphate N-acetyltransferase
MLGHVLDTARALEARRIVVVYGHGGEVARKPSMPDLAWARQDRPRAPATVQQAMPLVEDGDTAPSSLRRAPDRRATLQRLMAAAGERRWRCSPA